jgi:hypothetical protein
MKPSKLEALVNRRVFFTRLGLGIGGIGLARIIAACSNNNAGKLGNDDIPTGPSTPKPTDGDEYVPGKSDPVVADEAPKPPTAIHYITTIYLKSQAGDVVGLYEFASTDAAPPTVLFTLPAGVTSVTPYEYCTIHGLWANDAKPVS